MSVILTPKKSSFAAVLGGLAVNILPEINSFYKGPE